MLSVITLALAVLYRYYPLTLENALAHFAVVVVFISMFISFIKNCIIYHCEFLCQK